MRISLFGLIYLAIGIVVALTNGYNSVANLTDILSLVIAVVHFQELLRPLLVLVYFVIVHVIEGDVELSIRRGGRANDASGGLRDPWPSARSQG